MESSYLWIHFSVPKYNPDSPKCVINQNKLCITVKYLIKKKKPYYPNFYLYKPPYRHIGSDNRKYTVIMNFSKFKINSKKKSK